jgi:hypothetical protein|tara:strand:- start:327 stop:566 length:240 start_codon:yes stop_codon:yes gene_type:complete
MLPISKRLSAVAVSDKIPLKRLSSSVKFIVACRTGWTSVQSLIGCAESESEIPEVGEDNGVFVAVADTVESDPAVFAPG